jgi:polysaccharide biosynthesis protein PslG
VNNSLTATTAYTYAVASYDSQGAVSAKSAAVTTTTQALPPPLDDNFGVALSSAYFGLSTTAQSQAFKSLVSLGTGWIRFDMQWKVIQSQNSSTFNWTQTDSLVGAANTHHIKMLAILDYAPTWAASAPCSAATSNCPPSTPALFAAYVKAAVTRYAPEGISDWEIWNEPNNATFWGSQSNCDAYTAMLKAAYTAIKQVEPNAVVVTGGLAPESTDGSNISPTDFLSCIYKDGGEGYFDAVGDHPYSFPQIPSAVTQGAWAQMSATTPSLRSIMVANGDTNKKIWVTEFGAPTNGPDPNWYVSQAAQAQMVTDAMNLYKTYSWAGPFFWYTLEDSGTATSTSENFFGLLGVNGSTKPAYTTLQNIIAADLISSGT